MKTATHTEMPASPLRRRVLLALAAGMLGLVSRPLLAAPKPLVIVTSYPDEVVSRMEAAFERAHPEWRLQIVWRMPNDALPYLRQHGQGGQGAIDVYWSASPRNFATLAKEGALQKLGIDRDGLPPTIGQALLADPDGYYVASEMAGYGYAVNPVLLDRLGLAVPADWNDLADPRYAGIIALPSPARVGFAPVMVEIVLQAYGWERGWALWSEIAGNSALLDRGATFVTDEVGSGRRAVGLTIDFFAASAIVNGAPLRFVYPRHGGINPGHIAITAAAPNPEGARAFAEFVLSPVGQKLLTHPDIRKLPVRPEAYADLPGDYFNPFKAAAQGAFDYSSRTGQTRLALVTALFEQMLAQRHEQLVALWRRVHRAEADGKPAAEARRLLETPPLSEAEAGSEALRQIFRERREGTAPGALTPPEAKWRKLALERRAQAAALLAKAGV